MTNDLHIRNLQTLRQVYSGAIRDDKMPIIECLDAAIAALSPPALDAPVVGDVWMRAIAQVKDESLFADGVSADLHSAGIDTIEDAFMEGRKSVFMEVELEVASRLAASPVAAQAVTAYLAENANEAYVFFANDHESLDAYTADGFAITPLVRHHHTQAAEHPFAHTNAAPCDAQVASADRGEAVDGRFPAPIRNPEAWPPNYANGYNDALRLATEEGFARPRATAAPSGVSDAVRPSSLAVAAMAREVWGNPIPEQAYQFAKLLLATPPSPAESAAPAAAEWQPTPCPTCGSFCGDTGPTCAETAAPSGVSDAVRDAIQHIRDQYPYDLFPLAGESLACKGARMARLTCDNIELEFKRLMEERQPQPGRVEGMEYERGFRDGYERRHLEVLGALV